MIKNQSKQTYFLLEQKVLMDITQRGWIGIPTPPETSYDIIVDMGVVDGKRKFVTVQIKKVLRTTSRPGYGKSERVSLNGKNRNSYNYYDEDVTYLAHEDSNGKIQYIHKNQYTYLNQAQVKNCNPSDFPINVNMYSYSEPKEKLDKEVKDRFKELFV